MNAQTFLILLVVLIGAFHLARVLILIGAYVWEIFRPNGLRGGPYGLRTVFGIGLDGAIDLLTLREWIAPPRRRLAPLR